MDVSVRMAAVADMETLITLRFDYFAEEGWTPSPAQRIEMEEHFRQYYTKHLNEDCFVVLLEEEGEVLATALLVVFEKPANWIFPTGRIGTILNVLTYPPYRGQGLASRAMEVLIAEGKRQRLSYIDLSSSELGMPLYEKFGFHRPEPSQFTELKLSLL